MRTDQFEKAIEQHEILRQRGFEFPGSAGNLAEAYVAANRGDKALEVMREFVGRFPAVEFGHLLEGGIAMSLDRLDEAEAAIKKALALRSEFPPARATLGLVYLLREDFAASRQIGQQLLKGPTPNVRAIGFVQLVYSALYEGQVGEAIKLLR